MTTLHSVDDADTLNVRNLRVSFGPEDRAPAVDGVSLSIPRGHIVALVGESGSGKSVTARSFLGLAGDWSRVTVDELRVGDTDLAEADEEHWRAIRGSRIGYVLQDALSSLDPLRTVGQELAEALNRRPRAARFDSAVLALRNAGIDDPETRLRQYPHQLSGGLRQRALIASAIADEPDFIIADEPTTALDVTVQLRVLRLLRELADGGRGVLLITHDLAVVSEIADEVHVMQRGSVVESGPTDSILTSPQHPYTCDLLRAIPSANTRGLPLLAASEDTSARTDQASTGLPRLADATSPVIRVEGASVGFRTPRGGRIQALDDVSLDLRRGETLGIVGESGSGKSTLGRAILGLQKLDAGHVDFHGEPWSRLPEKQRRHRRARIQTISQNPLGTFDPRYSVAQLLDEPLRLHTELDRSARVDEAVRLLGEVGLDRKTLGAVPSRLSGGQRQRVAIAQALASRPDVLIADEPVSALDVLTQAQVLDLLLELRHSSRTSVVFISHDLGVVHHVSDRVVVMKNGRVVESGDVDAIFEQPTQPYTQELLRAIPTIRLAEETVA